MSIEILAKQFSKDNKVAFDKALAFATLVLANAPKANSGVVRGKQTGQEALRVRAAIKAEGQNLRYMGLFTAKQLADKLNTDPSTAINALNYLHKNEGVVIRAGQKPKEEGKRGRKEVLWTSAL